MIEKRNKSTSESLELIADESHTNLKPLAPRPMSMTSVLSTFKTTSLHEWFTNTKGLLFKVFYNRVLY